MSPTAEPTDRNWMGSPIPECRSRLTFDRSPVRESRTPGSARGAGGNSCSYRDKRIVPADADRDATLRRVRADAGEGAGLCHREQPLDPQYMGTAFTPAKTSPASWDAFSNVDAFVDAVLAELSAMAADGTRRTAPGRSRRWVVSLGW